MWREEPEEIREIDRVTLPFFGAATCLYAVQMFLDGIGDHPFAHAYFILLTAGLIGGTYANLRLDLRSRLRWRRGVALPLMKEIGPKYWVDLKLSKHRQVFGEDHGLLKLDEGRVQFQGLRTDFSVPRDLIVWQDANPTKVGALVGNEVIWMEFSVRKRLEVQGDFATLPYAFGNLSISASRGEFRPPPTEGPPIDRAWLARIHRVSLFWLVLGLLATFEGLHLSHLHLREAQLVLAMTFSATVLFAILRPLIRWVQIAWSLRTETKTPEFALRTAVKGAGPEAAERLQVGVSGADEGVRAP